MRAISVVIGVIGVVAIGSGAQAQSTQTPHHKVITIRWADPIDATTLADSINRLGINTNDSVSLRVTHFNFLQYGLTFTVEERLIESYALLDRLWSQILSLPSGLGLRLEELALFESAIVEWRKSLAAADIALSSFLKPYAGHLALSDDERSRILQSRDLFGTQPIDTIENLRRAALNAAQTSAELDLYERVLAQHDRVIQRLNAFLTAIDQVEHGQVHVIGKKKAGTVVAFAIKPVDRQGSQAGQALQSNYFVRSQHPLLLHVGYAASRLQDLRFSSVRSANGADLFLATTANEKTQALTVFLSYEVKNFGPTALAGIHVTLGAGLWKPGENLYAGGGLRVTRFVFTGGVSSLATSEGSNKTVEAIAGTAGFRELYGAFLQRTLWGPFGAVSIRVY